MLPRFARRPPTPALARHVTCYWTLAARDAPPWKARILPDGCNDLIIDLAAGPRPFVVGAMLRADVVPLAGRVDLLGIRFRPGGARRFLRVPLYELTDRQVALDALWSRAADSLADAVASAAPQDRIAVLERMLLDELRHPASPDDDLTERAVALMQRTRGGIGVRQAAQALGVGERKLERAFDAAVGLSPKRLARVLRFLAAVRAIGRAGAAASAAVALDTGYADQAHLIREFRRLAGVTPVQYTTERRVGIVQDGDPLPA